MTEQRPDRQPLIGRALAAESRVARSALARLRKQMTVLTAFQDTQRQIRFLQEELADLRRLLSQRGLTTNEELRRLDQRIHKLRARLMKLEQAL